MCIGVWFIVARDRKQAMPLTLQERLLVPEDNRGELVYEAKRAEMGRVP
jgi:hypothetical protein